MRRALRWAAVTAAAVVMTVGLSGREISEPPATLQLSSHQAGQSASHRLTFEVRAGELQIRRAEIAYPHGFRFIGFHALGPIGTTVGAYELDLNFDGTPERRLMVKSLGADTAYVDVLADGAFTSGVEPVIQRSTGSTLDLRLPFGGDADAGAMVTPFGARITLLLAAGLLVNPTVGGWYDITTELTTVDPDTGDASDGAGASPDTSRLVLPLRIKGPSLVTFAELVVEKFDLKRDGHGRYRFAIHGRFVPGRSSEGVHVARENTTVALDWFRQTVSGSAFKRAGHGYHYRSDGPGIERLVIWPDGRFQIDARELVLIGPPPITNFTLRIGNDLGRTVIAAGKRRAR